MASVPMKLPSTRLPLAPASTETPSITLSEIRFPAPGLVPPIKLPTDPDATATPYTFDTPAAPVASVPM